MALYGASRFSESLEKCLQAVHILERTGDRWEMSTASWHIAFTYHQLGQLQEAFVWSKRTYQASLDIGDHQAAGISLGGWSKATCGLVEAHRLAEALARNPDDVHTQAELGQARSLASAPHGRSRTRPRLLA